LKLGRRQKRIENAGFEDERELDQRIKKIDEYLKRTRKKDVGELEEPAEEPTFPLIDRPDADLTEDEIKEKRKQKLYKAGYDARMKIKAEKAAEKARVVRHLESPALCRRGPLLNWLHRRPHRKRPSAKTRPTG
jgi:actin-related protein 5